MREGEKISQIFLEWAGGWQGRNELMREMKGRWRGTALCYIKSKDPCAVFSGLSMGVSSVALGARDRGRAPWG